MVGCRLGTPATRLGVRQGCHGCGKERPEYHKLILRSLEIKDLKLVTVKEEIERVRLHIWCQSILRDTWNDIGKHVLREAIGA